MSLSLLAVLAASLLVYLICRALRAVAVVVALLCVLPLFLPLASR